MVVMHTTLLTRSNMSSTSGFEDQTSLQYLAKELSALKLSNNRLQNGLHSHISDPHFEDGSGLFQRDYISPQDLFHGLKKSQPTPNTDLGFDESLFSLSGNGARKSANMTETVPVPSSEHVAEIVGRQGCKIKSLRAKTNTYIKTPVRGSEPVFVVTGRKEDVALAKREILSAADHFSQIRASRRSGNSPQTNNSGSASPTSVPGHTTKEVRVPYKVVGLVVGPKGATIKRIQQTTSTYIVTPGRDKEPVFEVTGLPDNVEKAKEEIEKHIASRTGTDNNADLQIDDFQIGIDSGYDQSNELANNSNYHGFNGILNANDNLPPLSSIVKSSSQYPIGTNSHISHCNSNSGAALKISDPYSFNLNYPSTFNPIGDMDEGIGASGVNIFDSSSIWSDNSMLQPQRSNSLSVHHLPPGEDGPHPRTRRTNSDPLAALPPSGLSRSPADSAGSMSPVTGRRASSPSVSCIMCLQPANATLFPCQHNGFCMSCANEICHREPERKCCPVCRSTPTYALPSDCMRTSMAN